MNGTNPDATKIEKTEEIKTEPGESKLIYLTIQGEPPKKINGETEEEVLLIWRTEVLDSYTFRQLREGWKRRDNVYGHLNVRFFTSNGETPGENDPIAKFTGLYTYVDQKEHFKLHLRYTELLDWQKVEIFSVKGSWAPKSGYRVATGCFETFDNDNFQYKGITVGRWVGERPFTPTDMKSRNRKNKECFMDGDATIEYAQELVSGRDRSTRNPVEFRTPAVPVIGPKNKPSRNIVAKTKVVENDEEPAQDQLSCSRIYYSEEPDPNQPSCSGIYNTAVIDVSIAKEPAKIDDKKEFPGKPQKKIRKRFAYTPSPWAQILNLDGPNEHPDTFPEVGQEEVVAEHAEEHDVHLGGYEHHDENLIDPEEPQNPGEHPDMLLEENEHLDDSEKHQHPEEHLGHPEELQHPEEHHDDPEEPQHPEDHPEEQVTPKQNKRRCNRELQALTDSRNESTFMKNQSHIEAESPSGRRILLRNRAQPAEPERTLRRPHFDRAAKNKEPPKVVEESVAPAPSAPPPMPQGPKQRRGRPPKHPRGAQQKEPEEPVPKEPRLAEPVEPEPQVRELRVREPRLAEPQVAEPQVRELRAREPRLAEPVVPRIIRFARANRGLNPFEVPSPRGWTDVWLNGFRINHNHPERYQHISQIFADSEEELAGAYCIDQIEDYVSQINMRRKTYFVTEHPRCFKNDIELIEWARKFGLRDPHILTQLSLCQLRLCVDFLENWEDRALLDRKIEEQLILLKSLGRMDQMDESLPRMCLTQFIPELRRRALEKLNVLKVSGFVARLYLTPAQGLCRWSNGVLGPQTEHEFGSPGFYKATANAMLEYRHAVYETNGPQQFLRKYYDFEVLPQHDEMRAAHNFIWSVSRKNCDDYGIFIPILSDEEQREFFWSGFQGNFEGLPNWAFLMECKLALQEG